MIVFLRPLGLDFSARRRLAVLGSALALLLVVGAGGYAVWAARSPDTPPVAGDDIDPSAVAPAAPPSGPGSPSPGTSTPSNPAGSAGAQDKLEVKPSQSPQQPSQQPSQGGGGQQSGADKVVFSQKFAGRWVGRGTFPNQTQRNYSVVIRQGSQTAALTTSDNACTWRFKLFRTNNKGGFDGSMTTGAGCGPHKGGGFWIDGGRLAVMLWGEEGNFKSHFFWLDRP